MQILDISWLEFYNSSLIYNCNSYSYLSYRVCVWGMKNLTESGQKRLAIQYSKAILTNTCSRAEILWEFRTTLPSESLQYFPDASYEYQTEKQLTNGT